jgi:hypothetical protein
MQLNTLDRRRCASRQIRLLDVRFGSLADILGRLSYVRFTPESGHRLSESTLRNLPHHVQRQFTGHLRR